MKDRIAAVLFDLDDTLFDRRGAQRLVLDLVVGDFEVLFDSIDRGTIAEAFLGAEDVARQEFRAGASIQETRLSRSRKFLSTLGLDEGYADRITESYLRHYPFARTPVDGARHTIEALAPRVQVGVITNGSPDVQYGKIEAVGIKHLLKCVVVSEEVGLRKPDPGIFRMGARLLGKETGQCLFVGDSYDADIVGAKDAGMLACWYNPDRLTATAGGVGPDLEIRALSEVIAFLAGT